MRISDWSSDVCSSDLFKVFDNNDPDGVPLPVLSVNNARQKQRQFTQELRLTSPAGEPIEYVVGLYYFWQDVVSRTQRSEARRVGKEGVSRGRYRCWSYH